MHQILSRLKSFSPLVLLGNLWAEKVWVWRQYFQNFKKLPEMFIFKTTVSDMNKVVSITPSGIINRHKNLQRTWWNCFWDKNGHTRSFKCCITFCSAEPYRRIWQSRYYTQYIFSNTVCTYTSMIVSFSVGVSSSFSSRALTKFTREMTSWLCGSYWVMNCASFTR